MELFLTALGSPARAALSAAASAAVWGLTSRGAYLALQDQVLFLTSQPQRGPLILNLSRTAYERLRPALAPGLSLRVVGGDIYLAEPSIVLHTAATSTWRCPSIAGQHPLPAAALQRQFAATRQALQAARPGEDFLPQAAALLGSDWLGRGMSCPNACPLFPLLGLGPGLTPAGDDVALGFALAANRWGPALWPAAPVFDLPAFNQALCAAAVHRTTSLSAALIACAAAGCADEPLLLALDALITGALEPPAIAALLLAWGRSSGMHVFLGCWLLAANPAANPAPG